MKTVKQLIQSLDAQQVFEALVRLYPKEKKNLLGYKEVWNRLLQLPPELTELICTIEFVPGDDEFGETYYHVSGVEPENQEHYAIGLMPWSEWLLMPVQAPDDMPLEEQLAHILWEMTWYGFDQREHQDVLESLNESIKELEIKHGEHKKKMH